MQRGSINLTREYEVGKRRGRRKEEGGGRKEGGAVGCGLSGGLGIEKPPREEERRLGRMNN